MSSALGFAAIVIVAAIFMPDVLRALEQFLLILLGKATAVINALPDSMPVATGGVRLP